MIFQKRGLSDVITVALIILLAISAVVIVWTFVRATLQDVGEQVTASCIEANLKLVGKCNQATGEITVKNEGKDPIELKIIYYSSNADDAESEIRDGDCSGSIAPLAQQKCTPRDPDGIGPLTTLPSFTPTKAGVAAVIGDRSCPITATTVACEP